MGAWLTKPFPVQDQIRKRGRDMDPVPFVVHKFVYVTAGFLNNMIYRKAHIAHQSFTTLTA